MKKFRFKLTKLSEDENLVKIDYIDYNYFKEDYNEELLYNNIYFNVKRVKGKSSIDVDIENNKIFSVFLYLGTEDTHLLVNDKTLKILENLRDIIYNIRNNSLKNYLNNNYIYNYNYYYVYLDTIKSKIEVRTSMLHFYDNGELKLNNLDKSLFKLGNMFSTKEEAEKYKRGLLRTEIRDIKNIFKKQKMFLNNMEDSGLFYE